jgi:hypothetical protein
MSDDTPQMKAARARVEAVTNPKAGPVELDAKDGARYRIFVDLGTEHGTSDDDLRRELFGASSQFRQIAVCGDGARRELVATWRGASSKVTLPAFVTHVRAHP